MTSTTPVAVMARSFATDSPAVPGPDRAESRSQPPTEGDGERITENTLIRIAIDLLLTHPDDLEGVTEAQFRESVGL